MKETALRFARLAMNVRDNLRRRPAVRYLLSVAIAALALALQLLTRPVIGPDTYQIFLGAVALSVIFAGTRSGLATLSVSAVLKLYYFILPESTLPAQAHIVLARMALFIAIGLLICSIGGQLHASEGTLSAVLNGIADGVIASDDRGRVRFLNPVAQALTGWKLEHAQGGPLAQVARFERDGHALPSLSRPPEIPDYFPSETTMVLPSGLAIPVEGSVAGVRIPGEPRRVVVVFRTLPRAGAPRPSGRRSSPSCGPPWPRSNTSAGCCRSAPPARKSATTRVTGNRSKSTSAAIRKPSSATASARSARASCIPTWPRSSTGSSPAGGAWPPRAGGSRAPVRATGSSGALSRRIAAAHRSAGPPSRRRPALAPPARA